MIKEAIRNYQIKKIANQFELNSNGNLQTSNLAEESFFQFGNGSWGQHTGLDASGEYHNVNPEFGNTLTKIREIKLTQKK